MRGGDDMSDDAVPGVAGGGRGEVGGVGAAGWGRERKESRGEGGVGSLYTRDGLPTGAGWLLLHLELVSPFQTHPMRLLCYGEEQKEQVSY